MKKHLYYIDCVTNLHVGSGDVNFNVVDQEVEKDPISGYPVIHSSGIKGALRNTASQNKDLSKETVTKVFGVSCTAESADVAGSYRFFNADLLYRPLRAMGKSPCVKVTTVKMIQNYISMLKNFGFDLPDGLSKFEGVSFEDGVPFLVSDPEIRSIEGEKVELLDSNIKDTLKSILGEEFAIVNEFEGYDLPVIARNNLQLSSGGLWYEEYVPRESRFFMLVLTPDNESIETVDKIIPQMVQIGGNASIGYGYCRFTKAM